MGEDSPKNILEISDYIPVICMKAPYNKDKIKDNVYRISSFEDIYDIIDILQNEKTMEKGKYK